MNRLLVVEDETITSDMLRRYFEIVGYEVIKAVNGAEAVSKALHEQPGIIILDINLPDIDGYEVCRRLRSEPKTKHIPIIFLTQKDDRRDRIAGLELGADDFVTKPFDVEELRLRVHNIMQRMGGAALVDPRTSLPSTSLIQERLPKLLADSNSVFIDVTLEQVDAFSRVYGPVAANQAIRSTAKIIGDLLHEIDPTHSFIGHPSDHRFLIGISHKAIERVEQELPKRFLKLAAKFYNKADIKQNGMTIGNKTVPLMSVRLKRISGSAIEKILLEKPDSGESASTGSDKKKRGSTSPLHS